MIGMCLLVWDLVWWIIWVVLNLFILGICMFMRIMLNLLCVCCLIVFFLLLVIVMEWLCFCSSLIVKCWLMRLFFVNKICRVGVDVIVGDFGCGLFVFMIVLLVVFNREWSNLMDLIGFIKYLLICSLWYCWVFFGCVFEESRMVIVFLNFLCCCILLIN